MRSLISLQRRMAEAEARQQKLSDDSGGPTEEDLADPNFPAQLALLNDTSPLICALCTRRAAKSFSLAKRLVRAMRKHPGCSVLYLALTDESAERTMWKDVLKVIDKRWKLRATFRDSKMTMTLPNGSVLYLLGMDRTEDERNKLLGGKYAEVAIDECASFSTDLFSLVMLLKPAVADYRGTIGLYGTPGNVKAGLFFELTGDRDPTRASQWKKGSACGVWSGHCWTTFDNPYMREKWEAEIADLKAGNPDIENTPLFKQWYRGLWVIDDTLLVYKYLAGRNSFDGVLPEFREGKWHYVLGVDTGWKASAFTLGAYHDHSRDFFILESWKRRGMIISDLSAVVHAYEMRVDLEQVVIDGANKQGVEEMNRRHRLAAQPVVPAEKRDKFEFIDLMNDDLIQRRVFVSTAEWEPERVHEFTDVGKCGTADYVNKYKCGLLVAEWATLVIDERELKKNGKREEHPNCENHCSDSALYEWRYAYPYVSTALQQKMALPGAPGYAEQEAARQRKELEAEWEREFQENRQRQEDEEWRNE